MPTTKDWAERQAKLQDLWRRIKEKYPELYKLSVDAGLSPDWHYFHLREHQEFNREWLRRWREAGYPRKGDPDYPLPDRWPGSV